MPVKHVDVEGLVTDWAWSYFRRKATSAEKKLIEKELIRLDVDWKRVRFTHQPPKFDPEPPKPGKGTPKVGVNEYLKGGRLFLPEINQRSNLQQDVCCVGSGLKGC